MNSRDFSWLIPSPQPVAEVLEAHQLTYEFRQEVQQRQDYEHYCQWYAEIAAQHQWELQQMRQDIHLLGWFTRRQY